jgi:two-component system, cell cycle sensor histidine kinase and response regulator CckA
MRSDFIFGLENASWPAFAVNDSGMVVRANSAASSSFGGVAEGGGSSAASFWSQENDSTLEVFLARLERAPSASVPLKLRIRDGTTAVFQSYIALFSRDGQKLFLFQLFRTAAGMQAGQAGGSPAPESGVALRQKLDCALQLARSVALDFNNALTGILGHTSMLLDQLEQNHPWRRSLLEIEKSTGKAASVAADLATFSRQEKPAAPLAGNLNDLVRRATETFRVQGGTHITWKLQLEPHLFTAPLDELKMQQAFAKILENSLDALAGGGQITIRTRNQEVIEPASDENVRLVPGHYVCVEFEDDGVGIAPEILPRIFEPFFTTKGVPERRGLGLAWVYGIITTHGGRVAVTSTVGQGTCVRVYLPADKKIAKDFALQSEELIGTEAVLVIDDEELILTMLETVLSTFGYRVVTAKNGHTALEIFKQNATQIDLVITDMVMPRMGGRELIGKLRRLAPRMPIICSSGYSQPSSMDEEVLYLPKPFTCVQLLRKVKEALINSDTS